MSISDVSARYEHLFGRAEAVTKADSMAGFHRSGVPQPQRHHHWRDRTWIVKLRKVDPERATRLDLWLRELRRDNADRILAVTEEVALAWGRISAGRTRGGADTLIAATALVHDLILVTRNVTDFNGTGVTVFNPWDV